jgi:hypothetical protein
MNDTLKKVILDLTKKMVIDVANEFPHYEYEESLKLYMEIMQSLLDGDYQKDNIDK